MTHSLWSNVLSRVCSKSQWIIRNGLDQPVNDNASKILVLCSDIPTLIADWMSSTCISCRYLRIKQCPGQLCIVRVGWIPIPISSHLYLTTRICFGQLARIFRICFNADGHPLHERPYSPEPNQTHGPAFRTWGWHSQVHAVSRDWNCNARSPPVDLSLMSWDQWILILLVGNRLQQGQHWITYRQLVVRPSPA